MSKLFSSMTRHLSSRKSSQSSGQSLVPAADSNAPFEVTTSMSQTPTARNAARKVDERDTRLFDINKLMADLGVPDKDRKWFEQVNIAVRWHMNAPNYDASHDYEHIHRVVKEAHKLWLAEKHHSWARNIDPLVIFVAALSHDIGDEKYSAKDAEDGASYRSFETDEAKQERQCAIIRDFLAKHHCPPAVAGPASHIASLVSFTREKNDPEKIRLACEAYPALKFVQDADRLDGLGPIGITRASLYGGVHEARRTNTILTVIQLIDERFVHYRRLMKTKTGGKEAEKRWAYMVRYKEDMLAQADCSSVLEPF